MRLITYRRGQEAARLGALAGDLVVDVEKIGAARGHALPCSMQAFIEEAVTAQPILKCLLDIKASGWPVGTVVALADVELLAPLPRPRKNIFGIGLNYRAHVEESAKTLDTAENAPSQPVLFSKPPTTVLAPGGAIEHNARITQQLDWEVELAVIIGRTARRVPIESALDHVFGYSVIIDISARDNRRAGQWIFSKGMDTYAPFGPCIVTADEVPQPQNLRLWLKKNGEMKQDSNTSLMIFDVATLIADISSGITLEPGDIIATGTPAGVGAGRSPPEWLWPGDVIEAGIDGIGMLRNPVVAV